MGYGFGAFLLVVGLVLALAVRDSVDAIDLTTAGWIMAGVGLVVLAITAATWNSGRRIKSTQTVAHSDGTQSVRENRTEI